MNGVRISFSWLLPFFENELNWAVEMQVDYEDGFIRPTQVLVGKFLFPVKGGAMQCV